MNKVISINKNKVKLFVYGTFSILLFGCTTQTGVFSIGHPSALSPSQSLESIKSYAEYMQNRISVKQDKNSEIEDLDPLKTNRITRIEYANSLKGSIAASPEGAVPPSAADNENSLPAVDKVTIISDSDKPSGLLMDNISSLESFAAHRQRIYDLACQYQNNEQYLYNTLWIEPERQYLWQYLWRWADFNDGFKNYTKDYHADIKFKIVDGRNNLIKVVRLEPTNEGSVADEYYSSMSRSQVGFSGIWSELAAKGDLAESLRQANIEQRKYPILRGVINASSDENKNFDFHFIVSPRQHVEERTFRIPFLMSPYSIVKKLESIPYAVSAYFLVSKQTKTKYLNLEISACYKDYGNPERSCYRNEIQTENSEKTIPLKIELPQTDDVISKSGTCSVSKKSALIKQPEQPSPQVTDTDETVKNQKIKNGSVTKKHTVVTVSK